MLQIAGKIKPSTEGEAAEVPVRQLGKWQLSGEVCDGKCYAGAMRPGTGIGHKACANLCLVGGVPAVFVIRGAVEGSSFFMLADAEGKALGDRIYDLTAVLLSARGSIEMRGNLPIFKIDLDSVEIQ